MSWERFGVQIFGYSIYLEYIAFELSLTRSFAELGSKPGDVVPVAC